MSKEEWSELLLGEFQLHIQAISTVMASCSLFIVGNMAFIASGFMPIDSRGALTMTGTVSFVTMVLLLLFYVKQQNLAVESRKLRINAMKMMR
jgi:membrane-bound ClpP family serine protease